MERRKERKGKRGEGKEGKRNEREVTLVCLGGKGREGKGREIRIFSLNLYYFGKINTFSKIIYLIPPNPSPQNPFPSILLSK